MLNNSLPEWQTIKYERGSKIVSELDSLWLVKQGIIKNFTYDPEGQKVILGYWGKGDVIGQTMTYFDAYEIECLSAVELAIVPYLDWHYLAKEIRHCFQDLERLIYIFSQKNIEEKLLELLIYLGDKFGYHHQLGKAIAIPLTHRELSLWLNTTRVSITRSLNKLETKNYIAIPQRGTIILRTTEIPRLNYKI